jgi:uncharacterized membrane protein
MKRFGILLVVSSFAIAVFTQMILNQNVTNADEQEEFKFPKKVQAVIDKSCFGCHSENGKSDKAKNKLRWDLMHEYDKSKMVSIMDDIIEVIEKKEMPPEKFLENKPEAKPSDEEYEILMKWAEKEADKLLK